MVSVLNHEKFIYLNFTTRTLEQIGVRWNRFWRSNNRVNLLDIIEIDRIHNLIRTHVMGSTKPDPI